MTTTLITILAVVLWGTVFWPVWLVVRVLLMGHASADGKATLFAALWPITVPLALLTSLLAGALNSMRERRVRRWRR